ncbi:MAG TPA: hypothetical protein VGI57_16255 [Usitatibacter sp.]
MFAGATHHSSTSSRGTVDFNRLLAAARMGPAVDLAPIEWDGDDCVFETTATGFEEESGVTGEALRRRIRDRYIGARFPGAARGIADLESPDRVIKSARLYFEDGNVETALELLDLAIQQDMRAEALWLAKLELLFLARDAIRYKECAAGFRAAHATSTHWVEVARLGHALSPDDALFGPNRGPRSHEHYGPWPNLPNWIQASWDLTSEVLASDFHRLLGRGPAALGA